MQTELARTLDAPTMTQLPSLDPGVLVGKGLFSGKLCKQLMRVAKPYPARKAMIFRKFPDGSRYVVDKSVRDTGIVKLEGLALQLLNQRIRQLVSEWIEPAFGETVEWWEKPQILRYDREGQYAVHADAELEVRNDDGTSYWKRTNNRDISLVAYINEDFTGGSLAFPRQGLELQPKKGMVVTFRSGHTYEHGARPVKRGTRFAVVTWMKAKGTPLVAPVKPGMGLVRPESIALCSGV